MDALLFVYSKIIDTDELSSYYVLYYCMRSVYSSYHPWVILFTGIVCLPADVYVCV